MKARSTEYVIFDVETTGLSPRDGDRILELAALKVKNFEVIDSFESFINPQRDIPEQAQRIHQITPEMVKDAPVAAEVLPRFVDFIGGACLCGQNVKFDMDFLCYELAQAGYKLREDTPAVDTIKMAKYFMPHLGSYRLANIAQAFGVRIDVTHRAGADVELTRQILRHLLILAEEQHFITFQEVLKEFGVDQPVYRLKQNQDMLF